MRIAAFSLAVALALSFLATRALAAEMVVIESNAPSLREGTVVDSTKEVTVPAGAKITLMAASGEKTKIEGPFTGKPPASAKAGDPRLMTAVARLFDPQAKDTTALGAFRGRKGASLVGPDAIDAVRGGNFCVLQNMQPRLRRGLPGQMPEWGKLTAIKEGVDGDVAWAAGMTLADWPAAVPIAEGARYMLSRARAQPVRIVLHVEPKGLSLAARLEWMLERGCREQAVLLVDQLP